MRKVPSISGYAWLITEFVKKVARLVPLVAQKLPTLPVHKKSLSFFGGYICSLNLTAWYMPFNKKVAGLKHIMDLSLSK